jgi:putative flippase GtrA
MPTLARETIRFGIIGVICFVIDAGVTHFAIAAGLNPYVACCFGLSFALTSSWLLNRVYTFRGRRIAHRGVEFVGFAIANLRRAMINFATYSALVAADFTGPVAAVAARSIAGMVSDFACWRPLVFGPPPPQFRASARRSTASDAL